MSKTVPALKEKPLSASQRQRILDALVRWSHWNGDGYYAQAGDDIRKILAENSPDL